MLNISATLDTGNKYLSCSRPSLPTVPISIGFLVGKTSGATWRLIANWATQLSGFCLPIPRLRRNTERYLSKNNSVGATHYFSPVSGEEEKNELLSKQHQPFQLKPTAGSPSPSPTIYDCGAQAQQNFILLITFFGSGPFESTWVPCMDFILRVGDGKMPPFGPWPRNVDRANGRKLSSPTRRRPCVPTSGRPWGCPRRSQYTGSRTDDGDRGG
jgi:hypothetical protein